MVLECPQAGTLHIRSGQSVQGLLTAEFCLMSGGNPGASSCPFLWVPLLDPTEQSLVCEPSLQVLTDTGEVPLSVSPLPQLLLFLIREKPVCSSSLDSAGPTSGAPRSSCTLKVLMAGLAASLTPNTFSFFPGIPSAAVCWCMRV